MTLQRSARQTCSPWEPISLGSCSLGRLQVPSSIKELRVRNAAVVFGFALLLLCLPVGAPTASAADAATCTDRGAGQFVRSFVDAFNRGDTQKLDQQVATQQFAWYSTDSPGKRINDEAYNRNTLMAYFATRHLQHEHLALESFRFNGTSPTGLGNFEFELTRSADDGLSSAPYGGKGAIDCGGVPNTLVVWSMAREPFLRSNLPRYVIVAAVLVASLAGGGAVVYRRRHQAPLR